MSLSWDLARQSADKMFVNGICSNTVGLYVDRAPMPQMAEESVLRYEIPGRSGDLYQRLGTYQDITLTVRCFVFDEGYHPGKIYQYISSAKTLLFSRAPDYFYQVKKVLGITPQYKTAGKNFLNIQFVCSPFRYRKQNVPLVFTENPATCDNIGNIYSEPVYRLTIEDGCILAIFRVNGTALQILAGALDTGVLVIDLPRRKIYKEEVNGDLTIVQEYTSGAFWKMVLNPGYNTITWESGIEKVEVTVNERWL